MNTTADPESQADIQGDSTPAETALSGWTDEEHEALDALDVPTDRPARALLYEMSQRTGLSPFARQIYLATHDNGRLKCEVTIDGLRSVAESHGAYDGQIGPQWCGPDGQWRDVWVSNNPPAAARVGILRKDRSQPFWGIARYSEYAGQNPSGFWARMASLMTAKCAEALGLRKAFPRHLGGLYCADEMVPTNNQPAPVPAARRPTAARPAPTAQDAADAAYRVDTSAQVYEIYERAGKYRMLGHQVSALDTTEPEPLGFFLLRLAAVKARDADTVASIYREADRVDVLGTPLPSALKMGDGATLKSYLSSLGAALRHATLSHAEEHAADEPAADEHGGDEHGGDEPAAEEWDDPFGDDPAQDLDPAPDTGAAAPAPATPGGLGVADPDLDPLLDLNTLRPGGPDNPWDGVPGTWPEAATEEDYVSV
ncbi:recombinase RecT [Streptomyces albidoflavus]